jgi:hypothetical protein
MALRLSPTRYAVIDLGYHRHKEKRRGSHEPRRLFSDALSA